MKKTISLLFCLILVLLLPLSAAKAEMLPLDAETPTFMFSDEEELDVSAAGTNYINYTATVAVNTEFKFSYTMPGNYNWYWYWSTDGNNWTKIPDSIYSVYYNSSDFTLRSQRSETTAYITFKTTGIFYIRVYTIQYDSYYSTDATYDTYRFNVEQPIQPSLSVTPSSVSLAGGGSTQLSLNGSYVSSYDFYSSNPSVASVTYNNGSLILEAWNTGTATIRFTGYGNYGNASASCQVTVTGSSAAKPISYCSAGSIASQPYTGSQIRPSVVVKDEKTTLTEGVDYTLSYANNINPGTATVTVIGIGKYSGRGTVNFTITRSLTGASVTLSGASNLMYDGTAKRPAPTVTLNGKTLTEGTDYSVSYSNNTNAGTATVTITGIGTYTGTVTKTFLIHKAISDCTISAIPDQYFTGEAICPDVTIKDGTKTLVKGTDYTLKYSNNTNTGTATVTITGCEPYTGRQTVTFQIKASQQLSLGYNFVTIKAEETAMRRFVPQKDGDYTFYSIGDADTYGILYDSNMNVLTSNDDGGPGSNFNITRSLKANTIYYIGVRYYSRTASGNVEMYAYSMGWSLSGGILTVTGNEAMPDFHWDYTNGRSQSPWGNRVSEITEVRLSGVTSIGQYAFKDFSKLTRVTIPNSVTTINYGAFENCTSLTSVTIPNSVTTIGNSAFYKCSKLTGVTMLNGVTRIGSYAFGFCTSLTSVTIPNSVTAIDGYAFYDCISLTSVTIPNSVTTIGDSAFRACISLTRVTIPSSVTTIDQLVFASCSRLTSVTIPVSVTRIGSSAFSGCSSLTSVTIPVSVTRIESSAFSGCSSLTNVQYNGTKQQWCSIIIGGGCDALYTATKYCTDATFKTLSNWSWSLNPGVLIISGDGAMSGYSSSATPWYNSRSSIKSVVINNGIVNIGDYAFYDCSGLTSVTIPDSVTIIGNSAFSACSGLNSVTIPTSVISIGAYAFYNCSSLQDVWYLGTKAQWNAITMGSNNSCLTNATIHCLGGTVLELPASLRIIQSDALQGVSANAIHVPAQVTEIQSRAFADCKALTSIVFKGSPDFIADDILSGCSNVVIIAPRGSSAASWASAHGYKVLYS